MGDVMEVCRFVKFEFGDQVPTIKPHIERLDEVSSTEPHAQQVLPIQSQAGEVEELRRKVSDLQASLDHMTNQHNGGDTKDEEHARNMKEVHDCVT